MYKLKAVSKQGHFMAVLPASLFPLYINVIKHLLSFHLTCLNLMHKALFHRPDGLTSLIA